jgi:hypothetical protein
LTTAPPGERPSPRRLRWLLGSLIAALLIAHLGHLGHGRLRHWDEVYHFKVASSLLLDPWTPRLRVAPLLPVSTVDWWNSEVWLHKPILPFWVSALSMKALGLSPFAFRLPARSLACGRAHLHPRAAGLATGWGSAAAPSPANAFALDVVQGVQFADLTDIHLAA